jgi:hypothetical protein
VAATYPDQRDVSLAVSSLEDRDTEIYIRPNNGKKERAGLSQGDPGPALRESAAGSLATKNLRIANSTNFREFPLCEVRP